MREPSTIPITDEAAPSTTGRLRTTYKPMNRSPASEYLLTLRLIPLFPFFLVNLLSGLTQVKTRTYVAATALGIIPGSFVYTFAGSQLGSINSLSERCSRSRFWDCWPSAPRCIAI